MRVACAVLLAAGVACSGTATDPGAGDAGAVARDGGRRDGDFFGEGEAEAEAEAEGERPDASVWPDFGAPACVVGLIPDEQDNLDPLAALLAGMSGIAFDVHPANAMLAHAADGARLAAYDVVVFYNRNRLIAQAEHDALQAYLSAGGRLLVTGHDSLGDPNDALLRAVLRVQTAPGDGDLVGPTRFSVVDADHPIAAGPEGTVAVGAPLTALADDHDVVEAADGAGAITVAGLDDGNDKITAATVSGGGRVVYWNGNGTSRDGRASDWGPDAAPELHVLARNTIRWLCADPVAR